MTSSKLVLMLGAAAVALPGAALAQSQNASQTPSQTPPPATTSQPAAQTPATTAQTPAPRTQTAEPAQQQQPASVGDVVVNARANDVRTSIDSVSYSLANDLQATTGSLAAGPGLVAMVARVGARGASGPAEPMLASWRAL
jgi:hypothetical protein